MTHSLPGGAFAGGARSPTDRRQPSFWVALTRAGVDDRHSVYTRATLDEGAVASGGEPLSCTCRQRDRDIQRDREQERQRVGRGHGRETTGSAMPVRKTEMPP